MGYLTRGPGNSNEFPRVTKGKSPWLGETELVDEFALRLRGEVRKCSGCNRPTHIRYLNEKDLCPDRCPR
jgi:hypothetical protein